MRSDSPTPYGNREHRPASGPGGWISYFSRTQRPPTLVINPADDSDFEANVHSKLPDASNPEALQESLRSQYPLVVVHRRELSSEPITIWYVYRDGRWRP
jgi:hypothetical protein